MVIFGVYANYLPMELNVILKYAYCMEVWLLYYYKCTHTYTHTHTQNYLNSSWHKFNKLQETFLTDFGPYWLDSITQLLQIHRLHIHDANLPFHHIPKVLYWIKTWWLWRPFEYTELIVMFKKPVWDDFSFVTWRIILLEVAIRRWCTVVIKGWTCQ